MKNYIPIVKERSMKHRNKQIYINKDQEKLRNKQNKNDDDNSEKYRQQTNCLRFGLNNHTS